jgi:DNA adenine methylase
MKYMGGKNRIAKEILPIILKDRTQGQYYVELMAGGCNVIDKVTGNRIASDKSEYLMEMWYELTEGKTFIEEIPKDLYDRARTEFNNKTNNEFTLAEIGWIGFMASYNGRFFDGGYNGNYKKRDYTKESIDNIKKQIDSMKGVEFSSGNYNEIIIPNNSILYCDIPYEGTKQYATSKDFNYLEFWEWCRTKAKQGHKVFVSEYKAPEDFKCVWSGNIKSYMKAGRSEIVTEKLFTNE